METHTILLDTQAPPTNPLFEVVDKEAGNELLITLLNGLEPYELAGREIKAKYTKPDGTEVLQEDGIEITSTNTITMLLPPVNFSPGIMECHLQIWEGETQETSIAFTFICYKAKVRKRFAISLDAKRATSNREFEVVDGDNGNVLAVSLTDDGVPVNLEHCFVMAVFSKPNGRTAEQDSNGNGLLLFGMNELEIELYLSSVSPGLVECEILVFSGEAQDTLITSARFNFACRRGIVNRDTIAQTEEWPLLVDMMNRVEYAEDELEILNGETRAAAEEAHTAANRANAAAQNAESFAVAEAQRVANENGRITAEAAREAFVYGMSAEAMTLPADSPAWAAVDSTGESARLQFGIPKGRDGKDAVNVSIEGFYYMYITELGDLHVVVAEDAPKPPLSINENGDLIYSIA